jgi:ATP-dependent helicase HrpB
LPTREEIRFDPDTRSVVARRVVRLGGLVLRDDPAPRPPRPEVCGEHLEAAARAAPELALAPSKEAEALLARVRFAASLKAGRPLADHLPDAWTDLLPALCVGKRSFADLRRADLAGALLAGIPWSRRSLLDRLAPERVKVPSGASPTIDYSVSPPVLPVRIQQMFGSVETPKIGGGRVPVMLHLLAPNGRPAQVTQDLAGFWDRTYPEVRKELRGRYPKHPWPDDPRTAEPTNRTKRRRPR